MTKVIAFLPCRKGSERVKCKNIRSFAGIEGGLAKIKLDQLCDSSAIDEIVVSTDDPTVIELAQTKAGHVDKPIRIFERPAALATSATSTDDLVQHVPSIISEGVILWTHVTSPFVTDKTYNQVIECYFAEKKNGYDSLMSVTPIQTFIWDKKGPLNYDRAKEKWPRTQTLPIIYEINSAVFIAQHEIYLDYSDRIGKAPFLFPFDSKQSIDIDVEDDFSFAEWMWLHG